MVLEEILIDGVFVAALLAAVACLAYLVYATLLERHLLRSPRSPVRASAQRTVSPPSPASRAAASAEWQHGRRSSAIPQGRG